MEENQDLIQCSLEAAISKTMECMAFEEVMVMQSEDEIPVFVAPEDVLWAGLTMKMPYRGQLLLEIAQDYGLLLAEEVYGESDLEISDACIRDALAEILNTIAGRFLNAVVPSDQVFQLGLPSTGHGELTVNSKPVRTIVVNVGEHYLSTHLFGESFLNLSNSAPINLE